MNSVLPWLNTAGDRLAALAGPLFVQSSVLILALVLLDLALRRHVPAAIRYALWLLVPVKLLLPPTVALPSGIGYWIDRRPAPVAAVPLPAPDYTADGPMSIGARQDVPAVDPRPRQSSIGVSGVLLIG